MLDEITLRRYRETDKDDVYNLHITALKSTGALIDKGADDNDLLDIENHYFRNNGFFYIADYHDKMIGMGAIRRLNTGTAEIKRMRVAPAYQAKGIGKKILLALEEKAGELGYTNIILDTTTTQIAARKLYEANGYEIFKTERIREFDTLFYKKTLARFTS